MLTTPALLPVCQLPLVNPARVPPMFSGLKTWWKFRSAPPLSHLHVVLYTRKGCHLCATAWEELRYWQERYRFVLEQVDIDTDPSLMTLYDNPVPVVAINDKVRVRGQVNRVLLERLLRAEASRQR